MQQLQPGLQRFWVVLHVQDWRGANAHMLKPDVEGSSFRQQLRRIPNRSSDRAGVAQRSHKLIKVRLALAPCILIAVDEVPQRITRAHRI